MSLVGKKAPDFSAKAVVKGEIVNEFKLSSLQGKYVVLFFYPLDFTFVCPTEIHAFQDKLSAFAERNTEVVGVSTDSHFSHLAWLNTPKAVGGIQGVEYPLVADFNKTIARDYDVLVEDAGVALRGLFLIDQKGVVQHSVVNNLPLGRNIDEALRMVEALQYTEKHGEVCPANWHEGEKAMKATQDGLKTYFGGN
ncbi:thioredoxin peroxidase [bacterium (Candidatus Blackallbacteria) CG17_big_fil_post_rev_8_21_14_2_50_48_46]|uniref:Thioredoxin peroxidase n=1 Tax=bacterium (Candidatus Blackallbacteria) CG17_big_fil_post_rev_8_21_14_2_50_48_46 TaxID=2014261 RepID=A0A2M7FZ15_9BACT|nr:MAG: thioredoxin peroxidase [bacterium (Candidatus Blackallbacteria) CG18_big_fil_WC_8_21_14_2_50_49_26]PIW14613.1 MAG: thioredoxin peroxidase [bacterium (Candidatus Blackallbacteria) CG17_big_fil_post_rev_8_21_14_2_50_48_46]PIW45664.1 MAG: thioredoxin peroxidase [bacterium (Candidatus Blackallbacteria) CG13_big_fil_rev_8_21_14_2_50_49_14]